MTHNEQNSDDEVEALSNSLIQLDKESPAVGQARDMNNKMDSLEDSLGNLNTELESIRASVEEGLDRLGDNDMDLTSKVSDTYKRLGELDNTYKSLLEISGNINDEIKNLTGDISSVAQQSSAHLEKLEATSEMNNTNLMQQHQALVARIDQIIKDSNETTESIHHSVFEVREKILVAEHQLVAKIESLAFTSKQNDAELADDIRSADSEIQSSKARILKLQQIDEALDKRAAQLEMSSNELSIRSQEMEVSIGFLDSRSNDLSESVSKLKQHTAQLQAESEQHGSRISELQDGASEMLQGLFDLGGTERKHYRISVLAMLVIALCVTGLYFYQDDVNRLFEQSLQQRAQLVDNEITQVDDALGEFDTHVNRELVALNEKMADEVEILTRKIDDVNKKVQSLDDQAQSIDGRLSTLPMVESFGGDNIVHGPQWLQDMDDSHYVIRLAKVEKQQEMYELAQSYNRYLDRPVAYYPDAEGSQVMVYGDFASAQEADKVMRRMPYRINWQRPQVLSVETIKQQLVR